MARRHTVLVGCLGVAVGIAAVGEHLAREATQRRWREAVAQRERLEREFTQIVATHDQLTVDLEQATHHARELTTALDQKSQQVDAVMASLAEERRTVQQLQGQLLVVQRQMEQVQGELAMLLTQREEMGPASHRAVIELERVVVSKSDAPGVQGRVVSIHPDWRFVVVNLGWDYVRIGDTVTIVRNDQILAKGRVERVQERLAAVTVLPDWEHADIQVNDVVRPL